MCGRKTNLIYKYWKKKKKKGELSNKLEKVCLHTQIGLCPS